MPEITTYTGSEWHTSYGAKGHVFVVNPETKQETPIYEAKSVATLVDQDWYDVMSGKHGKWCEAKYEIPDGTILKLFSISTWRGRPNGGGGAYLKVDSSLLGESIAQGDGYGGNVGSIMGRVSMLTSEEIAALGIAIPAEYKRYYREGKVTITACEKAKESV